MFKREGRFDGQLRGLKSRQKEEHFTALNLISLSLHFFFLSPKKPIGFSFFPSRSLLSRGERKSVSNIMKKINNNESKSVARGRADALEPLELTRD